MAKLLLTSNGFYTEEIKNEFFKMLSGEISKLNVLIITTASPLKENNRFAQKAREDFTEMGFETVDFFDAEFDRPELLQEYDVIYINGGNPFTLLFHLKRSGADESLKKAASKNAIIVGVSAGALILGPDIEIVARFTPEMNTMNMTDLSGIGLTDKLVFPHYDREDLFPCPDGKTNEERIRELETHKNCRFERMTESQFILENPVGRGTGA